MNQGKRKFLAALLAGLMLAGVTAQGAVFADETGAGTTVTTTADETTLTTDPAGSVTGGGNGQAGAADEEDEQEEPEQQVPVTGADAGAAVLGAGTDGEAVVAVTPVVGDLSDARNWETDRNEPESFTIQDGVVSITIDSEQETNSWYDWQGKKANTGVSAGKYWAVEHTLDITKSMMEVDSANASLWIYVKDKEGKDVDWSIIYCDRTDGETNFKAWDSEEGGKEFYPIPNPQASQGPHNLKTEYYKGVIYQYIDDVFVSSYILGDENLQTTPSVLFIQGKSFGNEFSYTMSVPVVTTAKPESMTLYVDTAEELQLAISAAEDGDTIVLAEDIALTATVANNAAALTFAKPGVTLDGNGHTLTVNADNESGNALGVNASNITIQDLVIAKAANGKVKHGINVYKATNVTIKDVTVQNMGGFGLLVNASDVTATGKLELSGNGWGDYINVGWGNGITDRNSCSFNASGATLVGVDRVYADEDDVLRAGDVAITFRLPSAYVEGQPEGTEGGIYYVYQEPAPEPDPEPGDPSYPPTPVPDDDDDDTDSAGGSTGGSSAGDTEMPENGFGTDENGDTFFYEDGELVTGWVKDGDTWYYMDENTGAMNTEDWVQVNGTWYNFDEDGSMNTGWEQVNGTWYYMAESGAMTTGWQQVGGKWYYFKNWGGMATGWMQINGTWYYLQPSGAMATGWQQIDGTWYYLKDWGGMATGWQEVNGKWYYFYASGAMAADTTIDGYTVDASGAWVE